MAKEADVKIDLLDLTGKPVLEIISGSFKSLGKTVMCHLFPKAFAY
ncbi:MAG TPA: hypothetical protein VF691_17265 [Cytophagaceae bacterium]|jgi:hypothetical protein